MSRTIPTFSLLFLSHFNRIGTATIAGQAVSIYRYTAIPQNNPHWRAQHTYTSIMSTTSTNSYLRQMRKSDLLELAEAVGLTKYVVLPSCLPDLTATRSRPSSFATRAIVRRPMRQRLPLAEVSLRTQPICLVANASRFHPPVPMA